jgi:hypothetical protein
MKKFWSIFLALLLPATVLAQQKSDATHKVVQGVDGTSAPYVKGTYTFTSGPNSGQTVEIDLPLVVVSSSAASATIGTVNQGSAGSSSWFATLTTSGTGVVGTQAHPLTVAGTANQGSPATHANAWPIVLTTNGTATFGGITSPVQSTLATVLDPSNDHVAIYGQQSVPGDTAVGAAPKGTQAANALATQDLKDSGRSEINFTVDSLAGATSETAVSFNQNRDGVATGSVTSYVITSGKTLRLHSVTVCADFVTNADRQIFRFRRNNAGSISCSSSPVWWTISVAPPTTAVTADSGAACVTSVFPEGYEIYGDGTKTVGVCQIQANSHTTNIISVSVNATEY